MPPYIDTTNIELHHQVVKGRSVLLNCPAMGTPFPEVEWRKGHTPVQESGRLRFLGNGRQLEISYSEEGDSGQYVCVATNKAGRKSQEYEVTIFGKGFTLALVVLTYSEKKHHKRNYTTRVDN